MNILVLATVIIWSFGGGYQNTPTFQVVSSPEEAAEIVFRDKPESFEIEPDQKRYTLYSVNTEDLTVKEVILPFYEPRIIYPTKED